MQQRVYDLLGIGVGPFNLSLACLAEPLALNTIFFDQTEKFQWHAGLMLEDSSLQIPFIADLVSFADPTSRYSFLNYLKLHNRLYQFYIRERMYALRSEYNHYCQWVVSLLPNVHFGNRVNTVEYDEELGLYRAQVTTCQTGQVHEVYAKNIVVGTGTTPYMPNCCPNDCDDIIHSSAYLFHKERLRASDSITVIGSGQSAAEVFFDLLKESTEHPYQLNWITRSARFYPLEYGKLTLEMTSPDYVHYFHNLPASQRDALILSQHNLYKGINLRLIDDIYELLYIKSRQYPHRFRLMTNMALTSVTADEGEVLHMYFEHTELHRKFDIDTQSIILATGYHYLTPNCLEPLRHHLNWDKQGRLDVAHNYSINNDNTAFVQNVGLHTHGLVTPDLGMGCYRNIHILRAITGKDCYPLEQEIAFQEFAPHCKGEA